MELLDQAIWDTAHKTEGMTPEQIATAMGLGAPTFYNKANPHSDNDNFTKAQLASLVAVTSNMAIPRAFAVLAGSGGDPGDLFLAVLRAGEAQGNVRSTLLQAIEDDKISQNELGNIIRDCSTAIKRIEDVMASARKKYESNVVDLNPGA